MMALYRRHTIWHIFWTAFMVLLISSLVPLQAEEYLVVSQPRVKRFKFKIGNVTVGNPKICDFKANRKKKRITLFPKSPGETMLLIYDATGKQRAVLDIVVYPTDPKDLVQQVKNLLVNVEGITIARMNNKVIIDGEVYLSEDKERIRKVIAGSNSIVDLTKLSPDSNRIIARTIEKEIGLDEVTVRSLKGRFILEGATYSPQAKEKAGKIASLYGGKNIINAIEVREVPRPPSRAKTVQVTAHFLEVNKNYTKNFNFKWNPIPKIGASGQLTVDPVSSSSNFSSAITGSIDNILPKLNYFKSLGVVRVMENPTVSVKSGGDATIQSGTRIGFPVFNERGVPNIEWQDVGVTLEIRPYAQGNDVDMSVSVDISALGTPDIQGAVQIERSKIQTEQFVHSGESIVIGGVLRHSSRRLLDKPPIAGGNQAGGDSNNPNPATTSDPFPLGSLFTLYKSKDMARQRSQFMIFITPKILKFAKDANIEIKDHFNLYEVYPKSDQNTVSNQDSLLGFGSQ